MANPQPFIGGDYPISTGNRPVVIGIARGSGSGKTTVLRRIVRSFGTDGIVVLDHDPYYRDLSTFRSK